MNPIIRCLLASLSLALIVASCRSNEGDGASVSSSAHRATDGAATISIATTWTTTVDTLSDTVVVRTGVANDDEAALRLREEMRIGGADGDDKHVFGDPRFVLPGPGDGVYVWDHSLTLLRQYDGAGRFVRNVGGRGQGPGEYRSANGLVRLKGGRLMLWDPRNLQMNLYDSLGRAITRSRHASTLEINGWDGLLADTADAVYARNWFRSAGAANPADPGKREGYLVLGPEGQVRDSLRRPPSLPRPQLVVANLGHGAMILDDVPFAAQPKWTVSPLGYVVSGVGSRYAVTLHRPSHPLRIERELTPVRVTARERSEAEASITTDMRRIDPRWRWNGPAIPTVKAFFIDLRTSAEGRIWVERTIGEARVEVDSASPATGIIPPRGAGAGMIPQATSTTRQRHAFDIFSPDGYFLGTVRVPANARITYMRGDQVWGVVLDDLGRPEVVRWRIEPSLAARVRSTRP